MFVLLAGFSTVTTTILAQSVPHQILPARAVNTNGATILPDRSFVPHAPGGSPAPQPSPGPTTNFQALTDNNGPFPPDTMGAAGLSNVVTMLNTQVRIQTRSGTTVQTMTLANFWTSTNIGSYTEVFDPRIVYDPYNNRWIACASVEPFSSNSGILVGVSLTSNPTNGWNLRRVKADSTSQRWADFPMLGFNKDWIVVGANMWFTPTYGNAFDRSHFYVFNKTNLYAGNFTNPTLLADANTPIAGDEFPAVTLDNLATNLYLVQDLTGNYQSNGYLRTLTITGAIGSETLNNAGSTPNLLKVNATWDWNEPNNQADFAPQLGLSVKVQNGDGGIGSLIYRNGFLWFAHTAFLPAGGSPTHSAIQWYQVNPALGITQLGRIEDTATTNYYGFPSIAVNRFSDVLIGFSRFAGTQYVSANYAFRAFYDAQNTMRTERAFKTGEDSYWKQDSNNENRWGDYSATAVDPVNDADFWTLQEYSTPHSGSLVNGSGRWATWWANVTVAVPANDKFSAAQTISGGQGTTNGTNVRATKETGEPNHAGNAGGASVWYNWTAPANGSVTIDSIGSTFDTLLAVYTGSSVSALTSVASDNGSAGNGASRVVFNATSGTTYRIAVDGFGGSMGNLVLDWNQPSAPVFTTQPQSQNVVAGNNVTFTSAAIGTPTPTYQWKFNAGSITGATSSSYTKSSVTTNDTGNYTVVASNSVGSATSAAAVLTVYNSAAATLSASAYTNNQFKFSLAGVPAYSYIIQASTNLTNWTSIYTNTSPFTFTDASATNYPHRFYKAVH
jgi:hypothetical protein